MVEFFLAFDTNRIYVYRQNGREWCLYPIEGMDFYPIKNAAEDTPKLIGLLAEYSNVETTFDDADHERQYPIVSGMSIVVLPGLDDYTNTKARYAIETKCRASYREVAVRTAAPVIMEKLSSDPLNEVDKFGFNFGGCNYRNINGKPKRTADKYGRVFDLRAQTVAGDKLAEFIASFMD